MNCWRFIPTLVLLLVTETWLFDQSKYDALPSSETDKLALAAKPTELKMMTDGSLLAVYPSGRRWYATRAGFEATYLGVMVLPETDPDTPETTRTGKIGDIFSTPPPDQSAPLDSVQVFDTDTWQSTANRDGAKTYLEDLYSSP